MVWTDLKPSDILTAKSFDNAVTTVLAMSGSTNAIVHLVAVARRAGIDLTTARFDELARITPVIGNLRPSGQYLMEDFFYAGGLRALLVELGDLIDGSQTDGQRRDARRKHFGRRNLQRRRDPPTQQSRSWRATASRC